MANIEQIKSLISAKGGIANANQFMIELPALPFAESQELNILCRSVTLPGRQILTNERLIGPKGRKVAYAHTQDEVTATFLVLNDYGVKKYFEHWQGLQIDRVTFEAGYKDDYAKTVKIRQLKKGFSLDADLNFGPLKIDIDAFRAENVVYELELRKAFPTTMNEIQLNNEQGGLIELSVSFSFDDWTSKSFYSDPSASSKAQATIGLINNLNNIIN